MMVPVVQALEGDVGHLTLNRPERGNALSPELVDALENGFDRLRNDGARLIVFRGAGRHLCTGFDLSDLESQSDGDLLLRFVRIEAFLQKVSTAPMMTAAVGRGRVIGAGADLFAVCDRRIACAGSSYAFPGAGFGIVLGTGRLASRIGVAEARALLLSGRALTDEHALAAGLATDRTDGVLPEQIIGALIENARRFDRETTEALFRITRQDRSDRDLAELVRSAARPGLGSRITRYRDRMAAVSRDA